LFPRDDFCQFQTGADEFGEEIGFTPPSLLRSASHALLLLVCLTGCGGNPSSAAGPSPPTLSSVAITPLSPSIAQGGAEQFVLTGTFSDGSTQTLTSSATWTSSQSSVASINSSGFATSKGGGVTIITAASGSLNGSTTLVVTPATPGYIATSSLLSARVGATATLLNNGSVLVVGGNNVRGAPALTSAELYDPTAATFAATGSMNTPRTGATATLLSNGMVLVVGGAPLSTSTELYNPATGTFTSTGNLSIARNGQTATLLNNGLVLVTGGTQPDFTTLSTAELYNPATGLFTLTGSMNAARTASTATLLNNGTVLIAAGASDDNLDFPLASSEIYDPTTGAFTLTGTMVTARANSAATLLNNGSVLIAGGNVANTTATASAEMFNPITGTFSSTGSLSSPRFSHTMTRLNNGTVLISGGADFSSGVPQLFIANATAEIFDPATRTFAAGATLNTARFGHTATLLDNGTVLIAGGVFFTGQVRTVLSSAELYVPSTFAPPNLVSIKVNPATPTISASTNQRFTATGTFSDNSTQTIASVTWTSSNNSVASISNDSSNSGLALGVTAGNVIITATVGSIAGSTSLTVH
jgi:hypothetical protein